MATHNALLDHYPDDCATCRSIDAREAEREGRCPECRSYIRDDGYCANADCHRWAPPEGRR